MNRYLSFFYVVGILALPMAFSEETPIQYALSGATAEENKVTLQGAGFGAYPQASVTFGYLPTDNAFDGATDGQGAIVTAKPGEGVMIFGESVETGYAAMIRCSVRTDQAHAAVTLATIGDKPDRFVATNSPTNEAFFTGQYQRISVFYTPPSIGFLPVIQIVNTSATDELTAYIDNFEIYTLNPTKYYSAAFLDNDAVDPPADQISVPSEENTSFWYGDKKSITINDVEFSFRYCKAGSVTRENGETITVEKSFFLGETEITQKQWKAVMDYFPSQIPSDQQGEDKPVFYVSYNECAKFANLLTLTRNGTFRIPTVLEWEYACRAGTSTTYYWGEDTRITGDYAWYYDNSNKQVHPVKQKEPNYWHLYDMQGNVSEWTSSSVYYNFNILCGGAFTYKAQGCKSTQSTTSLLSSDQGNDLGFRLIWEPKEE